MKKFRNIFFFGLAVFVSSCSQNNETEVKDPAGIVNTQSSEFSGLTAQGYYFAGRTNSGIGRIDPPVFKKGDDIYLVAMNVGEFKKDKEGFNHVELHMAVYNDGGAQIVEHRNILGKDGAVELENNILEKPNARYKTKSDEPSGKYRFVLTVVDEISKDSTQISGEYFLE